MPNIRRTAPNSSSNNEAESYGGGKQLRVGGGKSLRPLDDDDDDEESSEEEEQNYSISQARGGGKQLRGHGGKYLRPSAQDDDDEADSDDDDDMEDDEDDDEVEDVTANHQPVRVMPRSGGKNLLRMTLPDEDDDDDSDEDEDEEEEEEKKPVAYQVVPRSGGKSLTRMVPREDESDEESEQEDSELEDQPEQPVQPVQRAAGGKALFNHGGGKTLRPPQEVQQTSAVAPVALKKEPESNGSVNQISTASRGKQLRQTESAPNDHVKVESSITPSRGKQLRQPEPEETAKPVNNQIFTTTPRGKQLRQPEPKQKKEPAKKKAASQIVASVGTRGKQLRKPIKDDDDDDEDEMELESDSSEEELEDEDDDDEDFAEIVPKSRPKRGAAVKKTIVEDEGIGEDEISCGDEDEIELDINNTEALIRDEADRKHLDSLPELEREAILAERFDKLKAEQDMKKAIREARRKETEQATKESIASGKRKAAQPKQVAKKSKTDGDEELAKTLTGRRESARDRDRTGAKSKKAAALAALKKEKKMQQQQQQQREDSSDESDLGFDDDDDDSDEDYDEDVQLKPWQKKDRAVRSTVSRLDKVDGSDDDMDIDEDDEEEAVVKKKQVREAKSTAEVEASLEDFIKVTIPRRRLARWCNEPFFNAAILECFVRLFIGEDDNGEKVYRLCEIVDVVTSDKFYKFPVVKKGDKPVSTNKKLRLKFGTSERDFPMYLISDAIPEEIDVVKYVTTQKNHRLDVLTKRRANKLRRLQDNLVNNYTYTTEDIERNLQQRKQMGKTYGNLGLEQTKMGIAVQAAREYVEEMDKRLSSAKKALMESEINADEPELTKNVREAEKLYETAQKRLEELLDEERKMKEIVENRKKKLSSRAKDMNWAKVNERAIQANQRADREANKLVKDGTNGAGEKVTFNPYARRRVKPKILWEVGQANEEEKKVDVKNESGPSTEKDTGNTSAGSLTPILINESHGKAAALRDRHQFTIDEEGLAQSTDLDNILGGNRKKAVRANRVRKGISLAEYLERKEQGTL